MGIDCTAIVEYDIKLAGKPYWEIVGYHQLNRDTAFFSKIEKWSYFGYPEDASRIAKALLEEYECYGECWLPMKEFMKMCKKHKYPFKKFYKKKDYERMRIIFRFDH